MGPLAGSIEKVELMRARLERGEPLHQEGDNPQIITETDEYMELKRLYFNEPQNRGRICAKCDKHLSLTEFKGRARNCRSCNESIRAAKTRKLRERARRTRIAQAFALRHSS